MRFTRGGLRLAAFVLHSLMQRPLDALRLRKFARLVASAARDVGEDNRSLPSPVCVLETLGRNAGWIVAATSLARHRDDDAPHLIYFPERRLSLDRIAADVERVYGRLGRVVVAVCEGQVDDGGRPFGADVDRAGSQAHR